MVIDSDELHHHDVRQPVDLHALREDIVQTFDAFHAFLKALTSPVQTNSAQPTTTTSAAIVNDHAMDADNDHHHDHQHMVGLPAP